MRDGSGAGGICKNDFSEYSDESLLNELNESIKVKHILHNILRKCSGIRSAVCELVCKCISNKEL